MKRGILLAVGLLFILFLGCSRVPETAIAPEAVPTRLITSEGAAPASEWDSTVSAAQKEGKIFIYGSTGMSGSREALAEGIQKRFGLKTDVTIGRGAELTTKILSERRAGIYMADVYIGGASSMVNIIIPEKVFQLLEPALILPEVKDPKNWFENTLPFFESSRTALRMSAYVTSHVAINSSIVRPEEIKSYRDLLQPKWKGKIIINDPTTAGAGSIAFYFLAVRLMGQDFMRELARQEPVINRELRLQAEWLAQGKYAILVGGTDDTILEVQKAGAPLALLPALAEGGNLYAGAGHVALFDRSPRSNAAKVFINWLLSREGQTAWSKSQDDVSLRKDVPRDHLDPIKVPDPAKKYSMEDEETIKARPRYYSVAAEIFAASLRR